MGRTIRGVTAVIVAVVAVTGCSASGTPTVNTGYARATVTGTQTIKARQPHAAGQVVASPDGQRLFYLDGGRPCLWTIADGSQVCAPKDVTVRAGDRSAQWSPDGSAVVFTDDYLKRAVEPDIWVMQADDGSVRDITDDHADGSLLGSDAKGALIDGQPAWLDATTIVFARQHGWHGSGVDISSIPASGGDVSTLVHLTRNIQFVSAIAASPDGSALAYSLADDQFKGAAVHLRPLDDTARQDEVVVRSTYDASMLSFSPDGAFLLVDSMLPYLQYSLPTNSDATVVGVADRSTTPVSTQGDARYPTWSPSGHALAFLSEVNGEDGALKMVTEPGGAARKLASGKDFPSAWQVLRWAPSGIVLSTRTGFATLAVTTS